MDTVEQLQGLLPRSQWSRRGFVMTSLATGFALSVQPVSAQTITTDTNGLEAGEVKVPVKDGVDAGVSRHAGPRRPLPDRARHSGGLWRARAHQGHLPPPGEAGYYAIAPELYARQGDPATISDTQELVQKIVMKVPTDQVMSDLDATVAYAKASGKAERHS